MLKTFLFYVLRVRLSVSVQDTVTLVTRVRMDSTHKRLKLIPEPFSEEQGLYSIGHPLEIKLVAESIMGYCSFADLRSCRQVSKSWFMSSSKFWKPSSLVRLTDHSKLSQFLECTAALGSENHYANFSISIDFLNVEAPERFWNTFGYQIKFLKLWDSRFPNPDDHRHVLFKYCPNMEELYLFNITICGEHGLAHIHFGSDALDEWQEPTFGEHVNLKRLTTDACDEISRGIYWQEIFNHYSSLETINLLKPRGKCENYTPDIFRAVNVIRKQKPEKLKFKEIWSNPIHLLEAENQEQIQCLMSPALPLQKLSLTFGSIENNELLEKKVIFQHAQTLKSLEFNDYRFRVYLPPHHVFPCQLENLQEIRLHSTIFHTLEFLKFTPNLRKLSIKYSEYYDENIFEATNMNNLQDVRLEKCIELELGNALNKSELRKLIKLLPNVGVLRMPMNNDLFEIVCKRWKKLTSLEIVIDSRLNESGISGLDSEIENAINKNRGNYCLQEGTSRKANITNLKELQKLSIWSYKVSLRQPLSFFAAHFGIMQLPKLQFLRIKNYEFTDQEIWDRLHAKYPWHQKSPRTIEEMDNGYTDDTDAHDDDPWRENELGYHLSGEIGVLEDNIGGWDEFWRINDYPRYRARHRCNVAENILSDVESDESEDDTPSGNYVNSETDDESSESESDGSSNEEGILDQ